MDDIADDALMDCVDKLDARKLKGNFSFGLDFLQETVETRFTHVSNEKEEILGWKSYAHKDNDNFVHFMLSIKYD